VWLKCLATVDLHIAWSLSKISYPTIYCLALAYNTLHCNHTFPLSAFSSIIPLLCSQPPFTTITLHYNLHYNPIPPTITDTVGNPRDSGESNLGNFISGPLSRRKMPLHVHDMSRRSRNACSTPGSLVCYMYRAWHTLTVSGSGAYPIFVNKDLLVTSSPIYTLDEMKSAQRTMRCLNLFCCSVFRTRLQDGPSYFCCQLPR
jgi:hypothetical protein